MQVLHRKQVNKPLKYYSVYDVSKETKFKDKKLYIKVITEIFKVASEILLKKHRLQLLKIGAFKITGYKSDKKLIDFGLTKKLNKIVYYTNFHTNRFRYKLSYSHATINGYYKFVPYRKLNRDLAKTLKEDE
jgi:hypothetical protein